MYVKRYVIGQLFEAKQIISVLSGLPYGMDKEYLDLVRPSGIIRTWISVNTDTARSDVNHELSLKVKSAWSIGLLVYISSFSLMLT